MRIKKWIVYAALICGLGITLPVLAETGNKVVVKGKLATQQGIAYLFIRDFAMIQKGKASLTNGTFSMETGLEKPTFYILTTSDPLAKEFSLYLKPGDEVLVTVKDKQVILSGRGSKLNQFYLDLSAKYSYNNKQYTAKEIYTNRVKAVNSCDIEEVKEDKTALLGYLQGEYLDKVFGPYMEAKVSGETDAINKVGFDDLNIKLEPEIVNYFNWFKTINEIMFAKMEAGKLTVRNSSTWIADFAKNIDDQKLRETYIVKQLDYALMEEDIFKIKDLATEASSLVKDPSNTAKIKDILGKINNKRYSNALPGADFNAYTFLKPDGSKIKISDYKGKYIFIDIWSTWCHPCVAEMPYLKKLEHEMEGAAVVFLSMNGDIKESYWQDFMKKRNLTGNQIKMEKGLKDDPFFNQIGLTGIPRFVIIDREGKMVNAKCCQRPSNPILKVYLNELLSK